METQKGQLGLQIPIIKPDFKPKLNLTPDGIRKWRSALPMAKTKIAAKEIYFGLMEIISADLLVASRLELLELIRPPLQWICQDLKKHYLNQKEPLTEKKLVILNLSQTLQKNIVLGYKLVINSLLEENIKKTKIKNNLIVAIFRVLKYSRLILFRSYQLYSNAPKNTWLDAHALYTFAKNNNILETPLPDEKQTTILSSYLQLLLLSATNPYQWTQTEQEIIHSALIEWLPYITLKQTIKSELQKPSVFIADLAKDLGLAPASLNKIPFTNNCITLDISRLASHINIVIEELREKGTSAKQSHPRDSEYSISKPCLQRLYEQWSHNITRKSPRINVKGENLISIGFNAAHYYINHEHDFNLSKIITFKHDDSFPEPLSSSLYKLMESKKNTNSDSSESIKQKSITKPIEYKKFTCQIVNKSKHGVCVSLNYMKINSILQPGDLIALKNIENLDHVPWALGVIRWLKRKYKNYIHIGIQTISPYAESAAVQIINNNKPVSSYTKCFIIPHLEGHNIGTSIITTTIPFKKNNRVNVRFNESSNEEMLIELNNIKIHTSRFKQFDFFYEAKEKNRSKQIPLPKSESESNHLFHENYDRKFHNIWDDL